MNWRNFYDVELTNSFEYTYNNEINEVISDIDTDDNIILTTGITTDIQAFQMDGSGIIVPNTITITSGF